MARGYSNVKFEWNGSHSAVIKNLGFGQPLQKEAAEILYKNSYDYMPYKTGALANNTQIRAYKDHANITHRVPYANPHYEGVTPQGRPIVNRYKVIHPLATSEWYDVAWRQRKRIITQEVDEARMKYRSFKYGK